MVKGIVRNLDNVGRVTIPKEIRESLKISELDPVDIYLENGVICIKPVRLQCAVCGCENEYKLIPKVINGHTIIICRDCLTGFAE